MFKLKKAVIIDKFIDEYSNVIRMLKNLEFEVFTFESFNLAHEFLFNNHIDIVLSDLIVHETLDGIENYMYENISKKSSFVFTTLFLENLIDSRMSSKVFSMFFEGMPKKFLFHYNPSKVLDQVEVDFLVEDFKKKLINCKKDENLNKHKFLMFNFINR